MVKASFLLIVFSLAVTSHSASFEPPDLNFEYQLHQAYRHSLEPQKSEPSEGWIENYRLQRGENLWSLSEMLYGDGGYWPKVWAQNPGITNPHLVRPGHTLELLLGSEDQAPAFRFSEEGDAGVELAAAHGESGLVEVPPPEIPPRPLIKIPRSFPPWQTVYRPTSDIITVDDSMLRAQNMRVPDRMILNGYVQDGAIEPYGHFMETELESGLPMAMQYVYIKLRKGLGSVGQVLLIVEDHGSLRRLNTQVEKGLRSHFIEVFGDLKITELAKARFKNSSDNEKFEVFRALVLHATSLTLTNHALIQGKLEYVDLRPQGPTSSVTAQIVGSTKHKTSALYGPGDIVFLNRGSKDGLAVGQIMDVHSDRSIRDQKTPVSFSGASTGNVKIVKVDGSCATGVILTSIDGILQGDVAQEHTAKVSGAADDFPQDDSGGDLDLPLEPAMDSDDEMNLSE